MAQRPGHQWQPPRLRCLETHQLPLSALMILCNIRMALPPKEHDRMDVMLVWPSYLEPSCVHFGLRRDCWRLPHTRAFTPPIRPQDPPNILAICQHPRLVPIMCKGPPACLLQTLHHGSAHQQELVWHYSRQVHRSWRMRLPRHQQGYTQMSMSRRPRRSCPTHMQGQSRQTASMCGRQQRLRQQPRAWQICCKALSL